MPSDIRIAQPWVRDLKTGRVRRDCVVREVATVKPFALGGFVWTAGERTGKAPTPEGAKAKADEELRKAGFVLINLPGGCVFEEDRPTEALEKGKAR